MGRRKTKERGKDVRTVGKSKMRKGEGGRKEGKKEWAEENEEGRWTENIKRKTDGESWKRMKIPIDSTIFNSNVFPCR